LIRTRQLLILYAFVCRGKRFIVIIVLFSKLHPPPRYTLFPTRRSSDLTFLLGPRGQPPIHPKWGFLFNSYYEALGPRQSRPQRRDRKSTRLNSSHVKISYAVFCLKKKTNVDLTYLFIV